MDLRNVSVRKFKKNDERAVSRIIISNLAKVNSKDYPEEVINHACELFTPSYVFSISNRRKLYVAADGDTIVGTATIDYDTIHTVFIDAQYHGKGVEKKLLSLLEEIIANNGLRIAKVRSSITAQKIFQKLGYSTVGEEESQELGKEIIMEKYLL